MSGSTSEWCEECKRWLPADEVHRCWNCNRMICKSCVIPRAHPGRLWWCEKCAEDEGEDN